MKVNLTVSDLRQYEYCPRKVYFTHCLGFSRGKHITYKMQEGTLEHLRVRDLEERRTLKSYGLVEGERLFEVKFYSDKLKLTGLLDMVLLSSGEAIPVEYKNSLAGRVGEDHKLQLCAYALLIEERWQVPVKRAFVHFIQLKRSVRVKLDTALRAKTLQRLEDIGKMVTGETMPDATPVRARCTDCEMRNFCPDIW